MSRQTAILPAVLFATLLPGLVAATAQQTTSQGAPPSGWTLDVGAVNGDGDATSQIASDDKVTRNGTASLRLSGGPDTVRWLTATRIVEGVQPGQRYRLTAWIRTQDVHQQGRQFVNCNVYAQFKDEEGVVIPSLNGSPVIATRPLLGTHDWTRVDHILRVPADAATTTIGCFLSCTGSAWFDGVAFEPLAVPDWQTEDTGRYVYLWEHEGTPPRLIVRGNAAFLEELEQRLKTRLDRPVQYFYYNDNARKGELTGNAGNAHVEGKDEIHSIFWTDRHEIVHLLTRQWPGSGTALLGEGLAVYLSGSWHAQPIDLVARSLLAEGALLPLARLVTSSGFRTYNDMLTYPQAASFVKYLFETYGVDSFREVYTATPFDPDAAAFDELLRQAYDKDLAALEAEWLAALAEKTKREG